MREKGQRIGAILGSDSDRCQFLGFGEYVGDAIPPDDTPGFPHPTGEMRRWAENEFKQRRLPPDRRESFMFDMLASPKFRLDTGAIVYGKQCFWGPQENIALLLKRYPRVDLVDLDGKILQKDYSVGQTNRVL